MDELAAVKASQAGGRASFGNLTDGYYKKIYRHAYQFTGSHHDADDVCQETFLRAFYNINKLKDGNCFHGWLFTIATNLMRKRIKESRHENSWAVKSFDVESVETAEAENSQPVETLYAREKAIIIQKQLNEMPEYLRLVTVLILMEGLAQKEAAEILNCSQASVSRHLETARNWLRARLRNLI